MKITDFTPAIRPNARSRRARPKTHEVISFLRSQGHKVYVSHSRYYEDNGFTKVYPKGGATEVVVELNNGNAYRSEAICNNDENFNKKIGICVALGRAIKNIPAELILGGD